MKFRNTLILVIFLITSQEAYTQKIELGERLIERPLRNKFEAEIVQWIGEFKEEASAHANKHDLEFIMLNGERYNIVDGPNVVKFHHETNKKYLVEIEAEKTPKFLFWGGNLIIKKFKIFGEKRESLNKGKTNS